MQINLRLKQILKDHGESGRGVIKRIVDHTKLQRHQVSALMKNRIKHLPIDSLGAICDYLVERHQISRTQLPAILFALEPAEFWSLLGGRQLVEICFGVREDEVGAEMIVASDSYLHGVLLKELFGAKADERAEQNGQTLQQILVPAFGDNVDTDDAIATGHSVHSDFMARSGDRAIVGLGSIKSNVVIELLIALLFGAEPFAPQEDVVKPGDRKCPFYISLRPKDPHPPSCHAGTRLSKSQRKPEPGIYYEQASGKWTSCPWGLTQDAALVMYAFRPPAGTVEAVMGGFSSRATRCLAEALPDIAPKLWPPSYDEDDLKVGVFIVRFKYDKPTTDNGADEYAAWRYAKPSEFKVIPLSHAALARRLKRTGQEKES